MINEEKLLLKDLLARLPYGVICKGINLDFDVTKDDDEYVSREVSGPLTKIGYDYCTLGITKECKLSTIRPYLRPMSSMTGREEKEFISFTDTMFRYGKDNNLCCLALDAIDWLNAHHFDYRGLIEMNLALEAKEGMYN